MIPSFPHRYCSGDVTSGQIRLHVTQYALFVWSTTHVELPGHRTSRHVSVETKGHLEIVFKTGTRCMEENWEQARGIIGHVQLCGDVIKDAVYSLLHFPWYCTSRSGWPLHFAFSSAHSSL